MFTLPETNVAPENRPSQQERIVFPPSIFRGYVSFREGSYSCFFPDRQWCSMSISSRFLDWTWLGWICLLLSDLLQIIWSEDSCVWISHFTYMVAWQQGDIFYSCLHVGSHHRDVLSSFLSKISLTKAGTARLLFVHNLREETSPNTVQVTPICNSWSVWLYGFLGRTTSCWMYVGKNIHSLFFRF